VQAKASWVVSGQKPARQVCAVSHALPEQFRRASRRPFERGVSNMAKIAKTGDRKKVMDTSKSTNCPKCGKPTRIVKRVKDRERNIPGGVFISCSACEFYEKL
jgi:DNA-directed RNA polymerase subunit M/transcription elongation factor TFIIS